MRVGKDGAVSKMSSGVLMGVLIVTQAFQEESVDSSGEAAHHACPAGVECPLRLPQGIISPGPLYGAHAYNPSDP